MGTQERVVELLDEGYTQSKAAEILGISKQAVNYHKNASGYQTRRDTVRDNMPWAWGELAENAVKATPYARLVDHVEYMVTGGEGMPTWKLERLRSWYYRLSRLDVVVEYDPNIPPLPGQEHGHWRYAPRVPQDGDLILRRNKFTKLTRGMKEMFRFPERTPGVE